MENVSESIKTAMTVMRYVLDVMAPLFSMAADAVIPVKDRRKFISFVVYAIDV